MSYNNFCLHLGASLALVLFGIGDTTWPSDTLTVKLINQLHAIMTDDVPNIAFDVKFSLSQAGSHAHDVYSTLQV